MRRQKRLIAMLSLPLLAGSMATSADALFVREELAASSLAVSEYESLVKEYKAAVKAHRSKIREAESKEEKRELRKTHPAEAFAPRFQALAEAGSSEGYLWLIERARDRGVERSALYAEKARLYQLFFNQSPGGEVLEEGVQKLLGDSTFRRGDGPKEVDRLFALALEKAPTEADQVSLRVISAMRLSRAKDEASQERGITLLKQLIENHPDHPRMETVKKKLFAIEHLTVGKIAPEFVGKTVEGNEIKLSDYRGKVVVLDFFGFW